MSYGGHIIFDNAKGTHQACSSDDANGPTATLGLLVCANVLSSFLFRFGGE